MPLFFLKILDLWMHDLYPLSVIARLSLDIIVENNASDSSTKKHLIVFTTVGSSNCIKLLQHPTATPSTKASPSTVPSPSLGVVFS